MKIITANDLLWLSQQIYTVDFSSNYIKEHISTHPWHHNYLYPKQPHYNQVSEQVWERVSKPVGARVHDQILTQPQDTNEAIAKSLIRSNYQIVFDFEIL